MNFLRGLLLLTVILGAASSGLADEKVAPAKHALLVGCTKYPNLPLGKHLQGPANDVLLVRDLLVKRFHFSEKSIVTLSEQEGETKGDEAYPTRANIEREFRRLARVVRKGDVVYIHLSGHGAQQPIKDINDPESYEPDGLSEIFLPSDIGVWEDDRKAVVNAIIDVEFRDWLKAIRARGAAVVFVGDCCHSGTIIRQAMEIAREVELGKDLKIPDKELVAARKRAEKFAEKWADKLGPKTRGGNEPIRILQRAPDLVALYAARPNEPTFEDRYPKDASEAKRHGLFTFTMAKVLTRSPRPLTYTELIQAIKLEYLKMGRNGPVPSVEGKERDREFLGEKEWPARSLIRLIKTEAGWKLNAGALHGINRGSIFAVFRPGDDTARLGHVEVVQAGAVDSEVRPCAHAGVATKQDLPDGASCKLVHIDYGLLRLRVHIEAEAKEKQIVDLVKKLDKAAHSMIQTVARAADADWLVKATDAGVTLLPTTAWSSMRGQTSSQVFGPAPFDDQLGAWIERSLERVARARNLLKVAAAMEQDQALEPDQAYVPKVKIELARFSPDDPTTIEKMKPAAAGSILREGDIIAFEITNESKQAIDITLLFVDNHYGIHAFFPRKQTEGENRLAPGETRRTPRARINARTRGLEHIVAIAVRSEGLRGFTDFTWLAQPSIDLAQKRGQEALKNPLGMLLQAGLFAEGTQRGMDAVEYRNFAAKVVSWTTVPKDAPAQPQKEQPEEVVPAAAKKENAPFVSSTPPRSSVAAPAPVPSSAENAQNGWGYYAGALAIAVLGLSAGWVYLRRAGGG